MAVDFCIIGERLKKARKKKHITQEEMAEKLNVSVAYMSRIERGVASVNLKRLSQICDILGITQGQILEGVSSKSENYLNNDFYNILKKCSTKEQKFIYDVAKTIVQQKAAIH